MDGGSPNAFDWNQPPVQIWIVKHNDTILIQYSIYNLISM